MQLSHNKHPVDGALVGAGSLWPGFEHESPTHVHQPVGILLFKMPHPCRGEIPLHKVPSMYTRNFLPMLYVCLNLMIMIAVCLMMVVPMGWDTTYCGVELSYHPVLGPLFGDCSPLMGFTYTYGPLWKALIKLLFCNCFQQVSLSQALKWVPKCHVVDF